MKTLLIYFNFDGHIMQILQYIANTFDELEIEYEMCHASEMLKMNQEYQPIMNLFFHPNLNLSLYLQDISNMSGHKLAWDMESPYEIDVVKNALGYFGHIFTSDKKSAKVLQEFANKNSMTPNIKYVPHACYPKIHKPMEVPFEYRSDLCFIGNAYPSRIRFFEDVSDFLKDYKVIIVGVGYRGMVGYQSQKVIHEIINMKEVVKYLNGAKVCLNLHRINTDLDMRNNEGIIPYSLNNRTYEIAACGRPQMVDSTRGEDADLTFDSSILIFNGKQSFIDNFTSILDDKRIRDNMGNDSKNIVLSEHTYEKRIRDFYTHLLS